MSAASPPIPQAGDEPVWVKDDDEDLEELVDLTGDAEIASSHQIDLQIQLCMVLFCLIVVLISLIALSWRQYGGVIMRSRHDPNWKVRELSPGVSPIMRSKGFGPPGKAGVGSTGVDLNQKKED